MEPQIFTFRQKFERSIKDLWNAITNPHEMKQWYFPGIPDFKAEVGFETRFNVEAPSRDFLHIWKVTEVIPGQKITYDWSYEGIPGESFVVWELSETPGGCKLTFSHNVTENFPQDDPMFSREAGETGWNYFVRQQLPAYFARSQSQA